MTASYGASGVYMGGCAHPGGGGPHIEEVRPGQAAGDTGSDSYGHRRVATTGERREWGGSGEGIEREGRGKGEGGEREGRGRGDGGETEGRRRGDGGEIGGRGSGEGGDNQRCSLPAIYSIFPSSLTSLFPQGLGQDRVGTVMRSFYASLFSTMAPHFERLQDLELRETTRKSTAEAVAAAHEKVTWINS